jgi:hypothetical protein
VGRLRDSQGTLNTLNNASTTHSSFRDNKGMPNRRGWPTKSAKQKRKRGLLCSTWLSFLSFASPPPLGSSFSF